MNSNTGHCYVGMKQQSSIMSEVLLYHRTLHSVFYLGFIGICLLCYDYVSIVVVFGATIALFYSIGNDKDYLKNKLTEVNSTQSDEIKTWQRILAVPDHEIYDAQFTLLRFAILFAVVPTNLLLRLGILLFLYKCRPTVTILFFKFCDWHTKEIARLKKVEQEDQEWNDFSKWILDNKIPRQPPAKFQALYQRYLNSKAPLCELAVTTTETTPQ